MTRDLLTSPVAKYRLADLNEKAAAVVEVPHATQNEKPPIAARGAIKLDPSAKVPEQLFDALCAKNERFKDTWNRIRKVGDGSDSAYDLALAVFAVRDGWTDQQIAGLIIHWRREKSDTPEKAFRGDYLLRTIAKARESEPGKKNTTRSGGTLAATAVELATEHVAELFHDGDDAYATIRISDHLENRNVRTTGFKGWLHEVFYRETEKPLSSQPTQDAIDTLAAMARFDGDEKPVFVRMAERDGNIYIDLGGPDWQAVKVSPDGWEAVKKPPVKFVRRRGMKPLPRPVEGGDVAELRQFVNVKDDDDWKLLVAWIIGTYHPTGPYPILDLDGEQASGKTVASRMLSELIDPRDAALRSSPRDERDLVIRAKNSRLVAFDNLSTVPDWLSDALCRISTGGGFGTRQLYTDDEEILFTSKRPTLLNGIPPLANRADLGDRTITVTLPSVADENRKTERELRAAFNDAKPRIFGAILNAVSAAMKHRDNVELPQHPRMADFARWIVAAEPALGWEKGSFLCAYANNRDSAIERTIEASLVGPAIVKLAEAAGQVEAAGQWEGTATELLNELDINADAREQSRKRWPKTPRAMASELRRIAPGLRRMGIGVVFDRESGGSRRRIIRLEWARKQSSQPPHLRRNPPDDAENTDSSGQSRDGSGRSPSVNRPAKNPTDGTENADRDGRDGRDGLLHTQSGKNIEAFTR